MHHSDNGPEIIVKALAMWFGRFGVKRPSLNREVLCGNGYCESLNSKLRDEFLNLEVFTSHTEAKALTKYWIPYYNTARLHSSLQYKPPDPLTIQFNRV